jgi:hypothetical protein
MNNEVSDNVNPITSSDQAIFEFVGEQFVQWLMDFIKRQITHAEILKEIETIQTKPEKIKKFFLQIFLADEAFLGARSGDPGFLRFAIANLSEVADPSAESALEILEKRRHEELLGHSIEQGIIKTEKRQLWLNLLKALGASEEEISEAEPKEPTRNFIAELSDLFSASEWQTTLGGFASYERSQSLEFQALLKLSKNNLSLSDKDLQILNKYIQPYELNVSPILDKLVFDNESKQLVFEGVKRQLAAILEFLSGIGKYL